MKRIADLLATPEAGFVIKIFVAICLIAIAIYSVLKLRDFMAGKMPKGGEYITDFESMRDQGLIDDKELNQLKSTVGRSKDLAENDVDDDFDG